MRRVRADPVRGPLWRAKNKAWWKAHPEKLATLKRRAYLNRSEAQRARKRKYNALWWKAHPEKLATKKHREYHRNIRRHKSYHLKRLYGITLEQWETMFEAQGQQCACCGVLKTKNKRRWHVDHCHETKKIRGILCHQCNSALAYAKEDISRLQAMINYLKSHSPGLTLASEG